MLKKSIKIISYFDIGKEHSWSKFVESEYYSPLKWYTMTIIEDKQIEYLISEIITL